MSQQMQVYSSPPIKGILLLGIFLLLLSTGVRAQEERGASRPEPTDWASLEPNRGFFGCLKLGSVWTDLSAINQELVQNTYQPFQEAIVQMGIGVERWNRGWGVGVEMYNFMSANTQQGLLSFQYATMHLNRRLWHNGSKQMVYFSVGGGGGLARLRLRNPGTGEIERLGTQGVLGEVAIHGTHHFSLVGDSTEYPALIGVSVGYLRSVDPGWFLQGFDTTSQIGLPVSPQGFFVRLSLGMGRWKGRLRKR